MVGKLQHCFLSGMKTLPGSYNIRLFSRRYHFVEQKSHRLCDHCKTGAYSQDSCKKRRD